MYKIPWPPETHHIIFFFAICAAFAVMVGSYFQMRKEAQASIEQKELIKTQRDVIQNQIETIMQLTGGNGIPKLHIKISEYGSSSDYKVAISIENLDKFPIYQLQLKARNHADIILTSEKEKALKQMLRDDKIRTLDQISENTFTSYPTTIIEACDSVTFPTQYWYLNVPLAYYEFHVKWLKGSYILKITFKLNEFKPYIFGTSVWYRGKNYDIDPLNNEFFSFTETIDSTHMKHLMAKMKDQNFRKNKKQ